MKSILTLTILLGACATAPPRELVDARAAYARAKAGPAEELAPANLHEAHRALRRAEAAFEDDGDEPRARDLAYVAIRRSEEATARARFAMASQNYHAAGRELERLEDVRARRTQRELGVTRERLSMTAQELRDQERQTTAERAARRGTEAALEAQRQETEAARGETNAALASLQQIANVREEERGTVVTLSGSVLFATGDSALLPIAQQRLDEVAEALVDVGDKNIVVEGHSDSRGSARRNDELSRLRAESVRDYLVTKGVSPGRIRAVGRGSSRPVADNATAEGRANNRRVEIVVEASSAQ